MPPSELAPTWSEFIAGLNIFWDPILCGAIAGLVLGYLGIFIVLRRMVFVSAAITHSAGLGVALAFYAQIHLSSSSNGATSSATSWGIALAHWAGGVLGSHPLLGAFLFGLTATLLLAANPERLRLTRESVVGLVFIFSSGAALLVGDRISQESHDIHSILFGTAVLVSKTDLYSTLSFGGVLLLGHLWFHRGLVYVSFDEESAKVQQVPVRFLEGFLLLSIGLMVSVTTRALGAMPVFAFSVLPAMAALSLSRRIHWALLGASLFGLIAAVLGYVLSYFLRFPVGACQTVVAALMASLAMLTDRLRR